MSNLNFWEQHVFMQITPDAMIRGVQFEFIEKILTYGIIPVAVKLSEVDADMIDELYAEVIAGNWQTWRYRLIEDAFSIAPSLAMICRVKDQPNPHAFVKSIKGNQHPHLMSDGQLRRDFGAINAILGIVHASDNPDESEKDALVFGLSSKDIIVNEEASISLAFNLAKLSTPERPETRNFSLVLSQLRREILVNYWHALSSYDIKFISEYLKHPGGLASAKFSDSVKGQLGGKVPEDILQILAFTFTPDSNKPGRLSELFKTIERNRVRLDKWQRLVLESSCYFPPRKSVE
ncbi:hypothetical protein IAE30_07540 [Pantoea sp. S61]|uniref:nucleoside-diphosphate kinase n=1 Tax=Pantoea sp. S61 TaxID=2767442 RepID=UPI00190C4904|nr:nucleoside-diphosphate kinase [Pantoea sp. S61]MBK0123593.1 hypothetical protein [Pantoea sp. S61]